MTYRDRLSHRFRRPSLAAGLILILIAALAVTGAAMAQEEEGQGQEQQKQPWSSARPCENYSHPYEADLCQQWRLANAAEETAATAEQSAELLRLQTLLAGAAAILLFLVFLALLAAAFAARRTARAVTLARNHQESEVRAYVDVDRLEFIETPESDGLVKVKVVFKNTGQTPAFHNRVAAEVGVREVSSEDQVPIMPLPERSGPGAPRLGRDATETSIAECKAIPDLADRVMNGKAVILVWGWTEYADVFDRKRRMTFQYVCNAETLKTGLMFKPMSRGKEGA